MTDEPIDPPPAPSPGDKIAAVARAGLSELPAVGTVVELLRQVFGTAYERRQAVWQTKMYELLVDLHANSIDLGELGQRDEFVTAVHDASRIALGEHLESKLDRLKAILRHAAIEQPTPAADLMALRYLRWVDELEDVHIKLLQFAHDPTGWYTERGIAKGEYYAAPRRAALTAAGFREPEEVIDIALDDLHQRLLATLTMGTVTGAAVYEPWITDRGRQFLKWIDAV